MALGSVLASLRETRVIALDGNPDLGTLADRVQPDTELTMRDLVSDIESVHRYSDLRRYTSTNDSRLRVLAGGSPAAGEDPYATHAYGLTLGLLEQHYDLLLTDCGTGLRTPVMSSILRACDQVVIVLEPSQETARMAEETLRELHACGHGDLASNALAVISNVTSTSRKTLDLESITNSFRAQVTDVVEVPHDPHLALGGLVRLSSLRPATKHSFMRLGVALIDRLTKLEEPHRPSRPR
ncbi:MinD/ParA family protein (plasmid) [Nocardiopsis eucommiae]|uniref:MinD/ParA family protein n=1 Tax=Nocardiopsis eucommiae TaxID=2831970 RepID=A0A975LCM6_9ACTN|nr:MinD/ParA family protein [Nocardiopsis eucommiae]